MIKFEGLGTALITPFKKDLSINWEALGWLVENQIHAEVDFLVPCGTTGESPTLSYDEHVRVVEYVIKIAWGRALVLAGTGSNSTSEAVELTQAAKRSKAQGVLVVSPYYNKPNKAGLRDYYTQIADVGLPIILYDIPGRTGKGVPTDLILELAQEDIIAGVKWASGDHNQLMDLISETPDGFTVLSGDDNLTFNSMALGGDGAISVLSNLLPKEMRSLIDYAKQDDTLSLARNLHFELLPLMRAIFLDTNPIPIKELLSSYYHTVFGYAYYRSPLHKMDDDKFELMLDEIYNFIFRK